YLRRQRDAGRVDFGGDRMARGCGGVLHQGLNSAASVGTKPLGFVSEVMRIASTNGTCGNMSHAEFGKSGQWVTVMSCRAGGERRRGRQAIPAAAPQERTAAAAVT